MIGVTPIGVFAGMVNDFVQPSSQLQFSKLTFTHKSANRVAHELARLAFFVKQVYWAEEVPPRIEHFAMD